jgi:hypothetical protein
VLCRVGGGRRASDVGCCMQHDSQHGSLDFDLRANGWGASNLMDAEASDASVRNRRPGASSSIISQ